jgi:hypothetical protein
MARASDESETVRPEDRRAIMPWADSELRAALELLPNSKVGGVEKPWSSEQDELLLYYWPIKRKSDVAKLLGRGENACRSRYELLLKES